MSDEILAEASASEQVVTVTSETPEVLPEQVADQNQEQQEERKFSQAELDEMIGKRLARERRKWERESVRQPQPAPVASDKPLDQSQFENPYEYADALAERKAEELLRQREEQKHQTEVLDRYAEAEETARDKYDDFEQVAYNPRIPITDAMAKTIQHSDIGPDIAYYLGSNPKEAERISRISDPFVQAKEIGRIESSLVSNPPLKKVSSAPAPIKPIAAKTSGNPAYDTTDPRSIETMSTSEWIENDRKRRMKLLEQRSR